MGRKYTGTFEDHAVTIRNGRPLRDHFRMEEHGFEFADHKTAVKNFFDPKELKSVYYPEVEQLIKTHTGANRVVIFDHTLRSGDEPTRNEKAIREPVLRVHNDYTEWSGPQRVRDLLPAEEAEELLEHRFAIVSGVAGDRRAHPDETRWRSAKPRASRSMTWWLRSGATRTASARPIRSPTTRITGGSTSRA